MNIVIPAASLAFANQYNIGVRSIGSNYHITFSAHGFVDDNFLRHNNLDTLGVDTLLYEYLLLDTGVEFKRSYTGYVFQTPDHVFKACDILSVAYIYSHNPADKQDYDAIITMLREEMRKREPD